MISFAELTAFDDHFGTAGSVCGIDEAGRGPLAGPVFAAAAILRPGTQLTGLNDSKKLTEKRRELLFDSIVSGELAWYGIGAATACEVDQINILQATFLAMNRAYAALRALLDMDPAVVLVDGNRDPHLPLPAKLVVGGDAKSAAIAAASVLAKVSRDRYMLTLHERYPQYGFDRHKGYGTAAHYAAMEQHGFCPEHRITFLKKLTGER